MHFGQYCLRLSLGGAKHLILPLGVSECGSPGLNDGNFPSERYLVLVLFSSRGFPCTVFSCLCASIDGSKHHTSFVTQELSVILTREKFTFIHRDSISLCMSDPVLFKTLSSVSRVWSGFAGSRFSVSQQSWCAEPTQRCTLLWPAPLTPTKTQKTWCPDHPSRFRLCCPETL